MGRPLGNKDVCIWPEDENDLLAHMWQLEYRKRPKPMEKKRCNVITGPSTIGSSSSDSQVASDANANGPQSMRCHDPTAVTRMPESGGGADSQMVHSPTDAVHIQEGTNNTSS